MTTVKQWLLRCIPGLSILCWIFVTYQALHGRMPSLWGEAAESEESRNWQTLNSWQLIYIILSVFAHICACIVFPSRLCWAVWHISAEVRAARFEAVEISTPYAESECSSTVDDKASLLSGKSELSGKTEVGSSSSRLSTPKMSTFGDAPEEVIHAIIIPSYKEDMDTLRETLSVLASHSMAKTHYDIYLAMEQRDPDAESQATALILAFSASFRSISFTLHPGDITGEVAGKSSNVSWAARQFEPQLRRYREPEELRHYTDTHLSNTYFCLITKFHKEAGPQASLTMYVVPIIFDRNSQQVNAFVRVADIFWSGAGLSGLYRGSSCAVPTSVYSLSMSLAGQVGGWDTGPESIGEDLHMYLKCYFATKGKFHTKIVYAPASQSNVSSDVKGWRGELDSLRVRYKQAMRHMWGSLDSGYAVQKGLEALFSKPDEKLSEWLLAQDPSERIPAWVEGSNLTHFTPPNVYEPPSTAAPSFSKWSVLVHYHRLFEAHFLPAHLTIALFSAVIYAAIVPADVTNPYLLWCFGFTGTLRIFGIILTTVFLYLYESYHQTCAKTREDEMKRVGLWENMEGQFAYRRWSKNWVDYLCLPVTGTLYGTAPAVVAEFCHFYTDKLTYTVSAKPQLRKMVDRVVGVA